jgi:uncharacterized RDD family membrane protein YckC
MTNTPFTLHVSDLTSLGQDRAVDSFRRLLWAEAGRVGVGRNIINVPQCINVGDGGVDAYVKDASPLRRFGGWAVDWLLGAAVWLGAIWWIVAATNVANLLDSLVIVISLGLAGRFANLVLTAGFTHWFGGTVGKLAFGIEVVDEQGKRLSFWRSVWREWFGSWVAGMALWLGFIWIFIDKERRGWHDMMAGTKVIFKRKKFWLLVLAVMAILVIVNAAILKNVWNQAKSNAGFYQEIIGEMVPDL